MTEEKVAAAKQAETGLLAMLDAEEKAASSKSSKNKKKNNKKKK